MLSKLHRKYLWALVDKGTNSRPLGAWKHKKRVSLAGDMNVLLVDNHGVQGGGGIDCLVKIMIQLFL